MCQQCTECGTFRLPPSPFCFNCQSRDAECIELPGTGTDLQLHRRAPSAAPDLADACPYVSGVVELDGTQGAGARMLVNIIDCDPETVHIGDRVEVVFEHVNDEMAVPRFRPVTTTPDQEEITMEDLGQLRRLAPGRARRPVHHQPAADLAERMPRSVRTTTAATRRSTSTVRSSGAACPRATELTRRERPDRCPSGRRAPTT